MMQQLISFFSPLFQSRHFFRHNNNTLSKYIVYIIFSTVSTNSNSHLFLPMVCNMLIRFPCSINNEQKNRRRYQHPEQHFIYNHRRKNFLIAGSTWDQNKQECWHDAFSFVFFSFPFFKPKPTKINYLFTIWRPQGVEFTGIS